MEGAASWHQWSALPLARSAPRSPHRTVALPNSKPQAPSSKLSVFDSFRFKHDYVCAFDFAIAVETARVHVVAPISTS